QSQSEVKSSQVVNYSRGLCHSVLSHRGLQTNSPVLR
ncbi:hypothetical protein CEXT_99221, partial [Caerostris extrusa]